MTIAQDSKEKTIIATPVQSTQSMADRFYSASAGNLGKRNAFTVHNYNNRRYYSSIDATVFLNGQEVTEVLQIQWQIEEQTMPLFGYNSYVFDEVAHGSRIVQGQFAINFVLPDYLNQLVKSTATDANIKFKSTGARINNNAKYKKDAIYKNEFSLGIGYGSDDKLLGAQPCLFFENVHLRSCGSALDTQGQGVVELYSFISRDISYRQ